MARSPEALRASVFKFLSDPDRHSWSGGRIARRLRISVPTANKYRKEYEATSGTKLPGETVGLDGKTRRLPTGRVPKAVDNRFYTCRELAADHAVFASRLGYQHPRFAVPFDPASDATANTVMKAEQLITVEQDFRLTPWRMPDGSYPPLVVTNAPYTDESGHRRIRWHEKSLIETLRDVELAHHRAAKEAGVDQHLVDLLPDWRKRIWWHPVVRTATAIVFITDRRFHFWHPSNPRVRCFTEQTQNFVILYTGSKPDVFFEVYGHWGMAVSLSGRRHVEAHLLTDGQGSRLTRSTSQPAPS